MIALAPVGEARPAVERLRWKPFIALIVGVAILKILYLAFLCPYSLVEDEAHYWEWSRFLDWSYYSKGPGVAWVIAASDSLWSLVGMNGTELAVRTPAVIASCIFSCVLAGLTWDLFHHRRMVWISIILSMIIPVFTATGLLMTIDAPFLACWACAAWAGWRLIGMRRPRAWIFLGAALGIGFLFKYTILLIVPGLILARLWIRRTAPSSSDLEEPHFSDHPAHHPSQSSFLKWGAIGIALALLGLAPVLIWNAREGWPTVKHLLGHVGAPGGDVPTGPGAPPWRYNPEWTLSLLATQIGIVGPAIGIMIAATLQTLRKRGQIPSGARLLVACALPVLIFYFLISFLTEPEGNWPIAGYVTLIPLAAWRIVSRQSAGRRVRMWPGAILLAAILIPVGLRADLLRWVPVLGQPWSWNNKPQRPLIPLGRIMGAPTMTRDAVLRVDDLSALAGKPAIIICQQYGRASLLSFYAHQFGRGDIPILCASSLTGGRRTQYDLWPHTNLRDTKRWAGRAALLVGGEQWHWAPVFDSIQDAGQLAGEVKASRRVYNARGFLGFVPDKNP